MFRKALAVFSAAILFHSPSGKTKYADIHQVDFKNFGYPIDNDEGVPVGWRWIKSGTEETIPLLNGRWKPTDPDEPPSPPYLSFWSVTYGEIGTTLPLEVAAVDLIYGSGGTANWHYLYIYTLENGQPKLMEWLESGSRAYYGLVKVGFQNGQLVLDFEDPAKRVGECCSTSYVRVHYRWQNNHFIDAGSREHGDLPLNGPPHKQQ